MFYGGEVRAHGGQGGIAGQIGMGSVIQVVLRGTTGDIRVWQGVAGKREEFSVAEARELCTKIDVALTSRSDGSNAGLWLDDGGALRPLIVSRRWLIDLLAALRRALRTRDAAAAMVMRPTCVDTSNHAPISKCIDTASEPGSWHRHLRHTAPLRATECVDVDADSS